MMVKMGNKRANAIWEHHIPQEYVNMKPKPTDLRYVTPYWPTKLVVKTFALTSCYNTYINIHEPWLVNTC